jgi:hypothetical protein
MSDDDDVPWALDVMLRHTGIVTGCVVCAVIATAHFHCICEPFFGSLCWML